MKRKSTANNALHLGLYESALPSSRGGILYRAFSYPTKISPETIALFIASHTKPGDTVLDTFAGSGTTGLAAILCGNPTEQMIKLAKELELSVTWGPRNAVLYELGTLGSFVSETLCNPPDPKKFAQYAEKLIAEVEEECGFLYTATDPNGDIGKIRYSIWTDYHYCPSCEQELSFWESSVELKPAKISDFCRCLYCEHKFKKDEAQFVAEEVEDPILGKTIIQRKRRLARVYGQTNGVNWDRAATSSDEEKYLMADKLDLPNSIPNEAIKWGDLQRSGYHFGITHIHHFYTRRNLFVTGKIFDKIKSYPVDIQPALKFLALSYNAAHSTLMTRVVVKNGQEDFVLTGAQSGVLYISSLPVEKNIFDGLRRKIKTIYKAFSLIFGHKSEIQVVNASSTKLILKDKSVDYVFTDPPFGDFIPYAEVNLVNESWLGRVTKQREEIIVSQAQRKSTVSYGKLMAKVFREIARVAKPHAKATVIFHSAKSIIWQALIKSFKDAGLLVEASSILDKLQASFKQTNSIVSVQGDPVILLSRQGKNKSLHLPSNDIEETLDHLIREAVERGNLAGLNERRLYSRYIGYCLENDVVEPVDARVFYPVAKLQLEVYG